MRSPSAIAAVAVIFANLVVKSVHDDFAARRVTSLIGLDQRAGTYWLTQDQVQP